MYTNFKLNMYTNIYFLYVVASKFESTIVTYHFDNGGCKPQKIYISNKKNQTHNHNNKIHLRHNINQSVSSPDRIFYSFFLLPSQFIFRVVNKKREKRRQQVLDAQASFPIVSCYAEWIRRVDLNKNNEFAERIWRFKYRTRHDRLSSPSDVQ